MPRIANFHIGNLKLKGQAVDDKLSSNTDKGTMYPYSSLCQSIFSLFPFPEMHDHSANQVPNETWPTFGCLHLGIIIHNYSSFGSTADDRLGNSYLRVNLMEFGWNLDAILPFSPIFLLPFLADCTESTKYFVFYCITPFSLLLCGEEVQEKILFWLQAAPLLCESDYCAPSETKELANSQSFLDVWQSNHQGYMVKRTSNQNERGGGVGNVTRYF